MNVDINFLKNLYRKDIIYHYTSADTAIDFILQNNQLKFNNARKSVDPIESKKAQRSTTYHGPQAGDTVSKTDLDDANEIHKFVEDLEDKFNLVCFCQNRMGKYFANKSYISTFQGNEEIFGFTKLRMWDQYADKFAGVCIALSKEKILSQNSKLDLIEGNIKYLSFQKLFLDKLSDIQGNYLKKVGKSNYLKQVEKIIKRSFFYKHLDYRSENEYRIGTLFEKTKCSAEIFKDEIICENIFLDISGCIEAIFVSSFANSKQKSTLLEYADKLNIKIIEMKWQHNSFEVEDLGEWNKFFQKTKP